MESSAEVYRNLKIFIGFFFLIIELLEIVFGYELQ